MSSCDQSYCGPALYDRGPRPSLEAELHMITQAVALSSPVSKVHTRHAWNHYPTNGFHFITRALLRKPE